MIWIFHLYADFHTKHSPSEKVSNRITQIAMPGQDGHEKSEISRDVPRIVCWVISHQRPRNGKNIEWMSNVALQDISLAQNLKAWGELFPFLKSVLLAWWWVRGWVKRQKSWKSLKNPKKSGQVMAIHGMLADISVKPYLFSTLLIVVLWQISVKNILKDLPGNSIGCGTSWQALLL